MALMSDTVRLPFDTGPISGTHRAPLEVTHMCGASTLATERACDTDAAESVTDARLVWGYAAPRETVIRWGLCEGRGGNYFFLPATVLRAPRRVLAFVRVRWPRTGRLMR